MCGISGLCRYSTKDNTIQNIERMKQRMTHRGPDADGTWLSEDGEVCFGHVRLSILELSEKGAQPMRSGSGRFVICYNGEIYNHREIAQRLLSEKRIPSFRGTSDTEVLLEAIEAWGVEKTLGACKGMFAFAVYDNKEKTLTLARDRVGEKPLYYGWVEDAFVFSSDLGSIAVLDRFRPEINRKVLGIYFTHGYIPAPYTIYEGISKLKPGTLLTLKAPFAKGSEQQKTYWSVRELAKAGQKNLFTGTRQEAAEELERLLRASIRGQMISDVPLGAFLSAGIDSSTIVSLMQSESERPVRTFTIGMEEKDYNEAVFAGEIARHLGTDHTELYITQDDAKRVVPLLPAMFAEPFADSSQIPTYLVSKLTRQHVTVSLSGDAGDELFCGYTSYASVERIYGKIRKVPAFLRHPASAIVLHSPLTAKEVIRIKGKLLAADTPEEIYRLSFETDPLTPKVALEREMLPYAYTQLGPDETGEVCHDIMLMDLSMYHPDDILVKVDRTAMAVSLETRVPLLDRDLVEFALRLPVDYLRDRSADVGKLVLRDVLYRYVPRELMERPKKGFSIPISEWLREGELRSWAESLVEEKKLREQGVLDPAVVRRIWEDYTERGIWRIQIWYILMFQAWYEEEYRRKAA